MDVTVVVPATDAGWLQMARDRAIPSARALGVPVVEGIGPTVMDARNHGLAQVTTEWVIHLDADDELEAGYVDALAASPADVRAPSVRYVHRGGRAEQPRMPNVAGHTHACASTCLPYGNWIVVGAAVRTQMVRDVGAWRDFRWSEDWDLWVRCYLAGASFDPVPAAVYRAHVRWRSRNRSLSPRERFEVHQAIAAANGVPVP